MFHRAAQQNETDTLIFLKIGEVYGELVQKEKLADAYNAFLAHIYQNKLVLSIS